MVYKVIRRSDKQNLSEQYTRESISSAVRVYTRLIRRHPHDEVTLYQSGQLPQFPDHIIAQHFDTRGRNQT